jgi:hypothetical protein
MSTGLAERAVTNEFREPGVYPVGEDDWEVVPFRTGPVWDRDPNWDGPRDPQGYILPKLTLGWQAIEWGKRNLLSDDLDEETQKRKPFQLTPEQMRFVLWFYAINDRGRFLYREVTLQRLKGHGKDPLAAFIAAVEFVGPCRFAGWAAQADAEQGLEVGDPVARPHARAWIQIAAVSQKQTRNTMLLFNGLFTDACKAEHNIDMGMTVIYAYGGQKQIEGLTSSPRSLEGNRPTLVIGNEPHQWVENNSGHDMAAAMERNATKAKGGAARVLWITNAYNRSEDSVGQSTREAYDAIERGEAMNVGMMYDTLEAPKEARLRPKFSEERTAEMGNEELEKLTRRYLTRVLEKVVGDSWWLDIPSLVNSILNPNKDNTPARARRWWFNQSRGAEDAWLDPVAVDLAVSKLAKDARAGLDIHDSKNLIEAGWLVLPDEPIVMFFDGSKSHDATALVGCRLRDGYVFTIGVWAPPRVKKRRQNWRAPRLEVEGRVIEALTRFNVVAFWADPSHAKDDDDEAVSYWIPSMDRWMQLLKEDDPLGRWKAIDPAYWPVKTGLKKHAVIFDMSSADRQKMFITEAEMFVSEIESLNDIEEYEPTFEIDGHPTLVNHLNNAVSYSHPLGGTSLMKDNRESLNKIDLAVCAVGARMLRRFVLNGAVEEEEEYDNQVWGSV